jgi:hypothetical protein
MRVLPTDPTRFFDWEYTARFTETDLTTLRHKAGYYATEVCFRESLHDCAARGGLDHHELGRRLRRTGLAVFRPDALAHGKVPQILDYYARLDLRPFFCAVVEIKHPMIREVWRYQLNLASRERIRLLNLLFNASPSILVLFHAGEHTPVPCAAIMADCKGSTNPADRQGWELRAQLGSPHRVEVYVHTADEPADVVRDGGIMLGPETFADALLEPRTETVAARIRALARDIGRDARRRSLDAGPAGLAIPPDLHPAGGPVDRWQLIRELGSRCEMNAGPGRNLIPESGTDEWWSRAGLLHTRGRYLSRRAGRSGVRLPDGQAVGRG